MGREFIEYDVESGEGIERFANSLFACSVEICVESGEGIESSARQASGASITKKWNPAKELNDPALTATA